MENCFDETSWNAKPDGVIFEPDGVIFEMVAVN
jgi:hypothetical protein